MARKTTRTENHGDFAGPDAEKEAIEVLATQAQKKNKKGGGNSGVTDEVLDRNLTLIEAAAAELDEKVQEAAELRGVLRSRYKVSKADGCDNDAIRLYLKLKKRATGEVVTEHRNLGRILRMRMDPLGTQWNLFAVADEAAAAESVAGAPRLAEAELAGQHAASNGEPRSNNPWQPGSQNHVDWDTGHANAEAAYQRAINPTDGETATH